MFNDEQAPGYGGLAYVWRGVRNEHWSAARRGRGLACITSIRAAL